MDDERLAKIEQERKNAIDESNVVYGGLQQDNQNLYNLQNEYANNYETIQNDILDKRLAYNQDLINQQKDIARQNKETEEKKALNDYTAYVNPYGYQQESLANNGLLNSGLSETTKLGAYNRYQNRLATANKVMQDAFTQYDNDINQARLNNDVQKAENALNKLKLQLESAQNYYSNKSNLSLNQLSYNQNLDDNYYNRYQTEYNNLQNELARAEQIRQWEQQFAESQRQYNESMAFKEKQAAQEQANWEKEYALSKRKSSGGAVKYVNAGGQNPQQHSVTDALEGTVVKGVTIIKNPFTGEINPDAAYGVWNKDGSGNGYQPDNVNGVPLEYGGSNVADYFGETGNYNSGGKSIDNQSVWTANGRYYTWDGWANQYVDITGYKK